MEIPPSPHSDMTGQDPRVRQRSFALLETVRYQLSLPRHTPNAQRLFDDGTYLDLTIVCGDDHHIMHKAIVCPRSEFFASACNGPFQEGESGIILRSRRNQPLRCSARSEIGCGYTGAIYIIDLIWLAMNYKQLHSTFACLSFGVEPLNTSPFLFIQACMSRLHQG
ncbi:uncharacterized protein BKA55DRAFT_205812 [Fusarium redolens]|uniref:BTB domain-containing protein n=1 Tax=Fusarium redolens TaxID=48865 RepID=A0A9P9G1M1_FUSRE|nr:uncharacterized protein BKA55DRAFT_205812 [Fusarium redolens]KAH7230658.1 hypothetical protein BKA55DRAFT_205812 [Fusarium redolens]